MTLRKRGLGRGLEALLADDSAKEKKQPSQTMQAGDHQLTEDVGQDDIQSVPAVVDECMDGAVITEEADGRAAMVAALFKNIQRENLILLEEAEALRQLIIEFESIVRADPS
ncbi:MULTISPECIES: hypothetical protein [Methylobacter]